MGFRDYDPGLNRFLSRDSYNGALADLDLGLNPWTMNRYGFAGGNPVSFIELDGHIGGLPDEDLRELRKAGYTYVMGKGVVPLPSGAASSAGESLVCEKLGACTSLLGSSDASSWTHQLTHAPCGARDWAEGFQTNTVPLDAGSTCLVGLSVSLGLGMPNITVPGAFNLSEGGGGTGRGQSGWASEPGRYFGSLEKGKTILYALFERASQRFLKWGITLQGSGRYSGGVYREHGQELEITMVEISSYDASQFREPQRAWLAAQSKEGWLIERWPGPENTELGSPQGIARGLTRVQPSASDLSELQRMLGGSQYYQDFLNFYGRPPGTP
jgi:RHS repeat-associated protein